MSHRVLQTIIGIAITDPAFREELLVSPLKAVEGFDLTAEERTVLESIRAKNIDQFAARLDLWLAKLAIKQRPRRASAALWDQAATRRMRMRSTGA